MVSLLAIFLCLEDSDKVTLYLHIYSSFVLRGFHHCFQLQSILVCYQAYLYPDIAQKCLIYFFVDDSPVFLKANAYERASGQCINFSKSMVCFSPNVKLDLICHLSDILNVKVVTDLSTYLGLPSTFSRGKCKDFQFLLDRV